MNQRQNSAWNNPGFKGKIFQKGRQYTWPHVKSGTYQVWDRKWTQKQPFDCCGLSFQKFSYIFRICLSNIFRICLAVSEWNAMLWFEVRIQFGTNPVTDDTVVGNNKVNQKCKWKQRCLETCCTCYCKRSSKRWHIQFEFQNRA